MHFCCFLLPWGGREAASASKHVLVFIYPLVLLFCFVLYGCERLLDWVAYTEHRWNLLTVLEKPKDKREHLETFLLHHPLAEAGRAGKHSRARDEREKRVMPFPIPGRTTSLHSWGTVLMTVFWFECKMSSTGTHVWTMVFSWWYCFGSLWNV